MARSRSVSLLVALLLAAGRLEAADSRGPKGPEGPGSVPLPALPALPPSLPAGMPGVETPGLPGAGLSREPAQISAPALSAQLPAAEVTAAPERISTIIHEAPHAAEPGRKPLPTIPQRQAEAQAAMQALADLIGGSRPGGFQGEIQILVFDGANVTPVTLSVGPAPAPPATPAPPARPAAAPKTGLRGWLQRNFGLGKEPPAPSAPKLADPAEIFLASNPNSRAVDLQEWAGVPFADIAADTALVNTIAQDPHRVVGTIMANWGLPPIRWVAEALYDVIGFSRRATEDPGARAFAETLGRHVAREARTGKYSMLMSQRLPPHPAGGGEYWDLASGMNSGGFFLGLSPGVRYRFFDRDPMPVAYLDEFRRILEGEGVLEPGQVQVVERDIRTLERPEKPLSVIRAKNVTAYVDGFQDQLEPMTDWLEPGGRLIIQNDPWTTQRMTIVRDLGGMVQRLIAKGWGFDFSLIRGRTEGHKDLDLMVLTRPGPGQRAPVLGWEHYLDQVFSIASRESGGGW